MNSTIFLLIFWSLFNVTQPISVRYKHLDPSLHSICQRAERNNRRIQVHASFQAQETLWLIASSIGHSFPVREDYFLIRMIRLEDQSTVNQSIISMEVMEDVTALYRDSTIFQTMTNYPESFHLNFYKHAAYPTLAVVTGNPNIEAERRYLMMQEYEISAIDWSLQQKGDPVELEPSEREANDTFGFFTLTRLWENDRIKCPNPNDRLLYKCVFRGWQSPSDIRLGFFRSLFVWPYHLASELAVVYYTSILEPAKNFANYRYILMNRGDPRVGRWEFANPYRTDIANDWMAVDGINENVTSAVRLSSRYWNEQSRNQSGDEIKTKKVKYFEFYETGTYDIIEMKIRTNGSRTHIFMNETRRFSAKDPDQTNRIYDLLGCSSLPRLRSDKKFCPGECHCSEDDYANNRVNCKSINLKKFPRKFDHQNREVDVSGNRIFGLPEHQMRRSRALRLQVINASHNHMHFIHETAFEGMANLTVLDLSGNHLSIKTTFGNLKNILKPVRGQLMELRLKDFALEKIEENFFQGFVSLKILDLDDNHIQTLPKNEIKGNMKKLNKIYLRNNPLICDCNLSQAYEKYSRFEAAPRCSDDFGDDNHPYFPSWNDYRFTPSMLVCRLNQHRTFWYPFMCGPQLEMYRVINDVRCSINKNREIPQKWDFRTVQIVFLKTGLIITDASEVAQKIKITVPYLLSLKLTGHKIRKIRGKAFAPLYSLWELWISHNKITSISRDAFLNLTALKILHLEYNQMQTLPGDFPDRTQIPAIKNLTIHRNPFICNCRLFNYWRFMKQQKRNKMPTVIGMPHCWYLWENNTGEYSCFFYLEAFKRHNWNCSETGRGVLDPDATLPTTTVTFRNYQDMSTGESDLINRWIVLFAGLVFLALGLFGCLLIRTSRRVNKKQPLSDENDAETKPLLSKSAKAN